MPTLIGTTHRDPKTGIFTGVDLMVTPKLELQVRVIDSVECEVEIRHVDTDPTPMIHGLVIKYEHVRMLRDACTRILDEHVAALHHKAKTP